MKGSFNEKSLLAYAELVAEKIDVDFAEGEVYDFTRCVRANGSFYGTSGRCRQGSPAGPKEEEGVKGNPRDPVAGLREQERSRQAKQAAEQKAKTLADAKEEMKSIADEIKNRGPHTKEELADLNQKMKYAANRAKQIESGKTMTREQFQAGLRKMEEGKAKKPEAPLRGQNLANKMMDHVNISNRVAANHGGAIRTKAAKEEHAAELKKAGVPDRATLTAALKAQRDEAKKPQ